MRSIFKILLLLLIPVLAQAQQSHPDSLKRNLNSANSDSVRYLRLGDLDEYYSEVNRDSALYYLDEALSIAKKNGALLDEAKALDEKGYILGHLNKFPESLACFQLALKLAEDPASENKIVWYHIKNQTPHQTRIGALANIHHDMGHLMGVTNNIDQQIEQYKLTSKLATQAHDEVLMSLVNMNLGHVYEKLNRLDSALILEQNAVMLSKQTGYKKYLGLVYDIMGGIYLKNGNAVLGIKYLREALNTSIEQKNLANASNACKDITDYYLTISQKDSSLFYARKTLSFLHAMGNNQFMDRAYVNLYQSYELANKTDSAYKYMRLALITKDNSFKATVKSLAEFQKLSFKTQLYAQELEKEKTAIQIRIRTYVLLAAIAVFMLIATAFYINIRQKQKINILLLRQNNEILRQKEEIESQRDNLEKTLADLKATQAQLIHSEKMASLGELTAGIAHEIQNPLNFVNNFSEVSKELLSELKDELDKGDIEEARIISNDVILNLEKINHHGKRADVIVKGMLEHSRAGTRQKEPTDINALADEYLRLAYHGLRAKDKNFNAELVNNFDKNLPKVNVIPQDIGRVLLNLFNNAFYAVSQKKKTAGAGYKPEVSVTTSVQKDNVYIVVKDNGTGIANAIKDKIMQPFFTTKPTGQGTGLGLSLSYDIIKSNGGDIKVETEEGIFTEFTVQLPLI